MAQLARRSTVKQKVKGSNPLNVKLVSKIFQGTSQFFEDSTFLKSSNEFLSFCRSNKVSRASDLRLFTMNPFQFRFECYDIETFLLL